MKNLRKFLLLLVLSLVVLVPSFSDETPVSEMTTQEILTELIQLNEQRALELDLRENSLSLREANLDTRENNLNERENSMIALGDFSQSLREEVSRNQRADFWRGFGYGFTAGFVAGGAGGFTLGVKIPIN